MTIPMTMAMTMAMTMTIIDKLFQVRHEGRVVDTMQMEKNFNIVSPKTMTMPMTMTIAMTIVSITVLFC